jgi:hypothetical protein
MANRHSRYLQDKNQATSVTSLPNIGTNLNATSLQDWIEKAFFDPNYVSNHISSLSYNTGNSTLTLTMNDSASTTYSAVIDTTDQLTFYGGLTKSGDFVSLGGDLGNGPGDILFSDSFQATTIQWGASIDSNNNPAQYEFNLGNGTGARAISIFNSNDDALISNTLYQKNSPVGSSIISQSIGNYARTSNTTFDMTLTSGGDHSINITSDFGSFRGIEYAADYSANYTNRSLVDKEYVDTSISTGGFSVTNEANNRIITSTGSSTGNAEANLTFDGTILGINTSGGLTCSPTSTFGFRILSDGDTDTGSTPLTTIDSSIVGAAVSTRPLVGFSNDLNYMTYVYANSWDYQGNNLVNFGLSDNPTTTANGSLRYDNSGNQTLEVYDDTSASWLSIGGSGLTVDSNFKFIGVIAAQSNFTTSTTYMHWHQINDEVTCFVAITGTPSSSGTITVDLHPPVSTNNFTAPYNSIGQGYFESPDGNEFSYVNAVTSTNTVRLTSTANGTSSGIFYVSYSYEIKH